MDSTYYLGLSQIVGHTLSPKYDIKVTFSGYETSKVTRSGNFGFYCSYNGEVFADGGYYYNIEGGELVATKTMSAGTKVSNPEDNVDNQTGKITKINSVFWLLF